MSKLEGLGSDSNSVCVLEQVVPNCFASLSSSIELKWMGEWENLATIVKSDLRRKEYVSRHLNHAATL